MLQISISISDDEDVRIFDFVETQELVLVNTLFKKPATRLITYRSGPHATQLEA